MTLLSKILPSRTFLAQIVAAGGLVTISDVSCQLLVEKKPRELYDPWRTARFIAVTTILLAPFQFHWFRFLSNRFRGNSLRVGVKRMLTDQLIAAPLLTPLVLFTLKALELKSVPEAIDALKEMLAPVLINNYKVWPLVQLVNMTVVPLNLRVVFLQFIGIFWNIYISYVANQVKEQRTKAEGDVIYGRDSTR